MELLVLAVQKGSGQVGKNMNHVRILRQKREDFTAKLMPGPRQPDGEMGEFSMPPALALCISSTDTTV